MRCVICHDLMVTFEAIERHWADLSRSLSGAYVVVHRFCMAYTIHYVSETHTRTSVCILTNLHMGKICS